MPGAALADTRKKDVALRAISFAENHGSPRHPLNDSMDSGELFNFLLASAAAMNFHWGKEEPDQGTHWL